MAEWISVYCREPIQLDGNEIRRWIESADLSTWAETLYDEDEIAEAVAESVLASVRIHANAMINVYWAESRRPLQISSSSSVGDDISEILTDVLKGADGAGPDLIRRHLASVQQVFNIEMAATDSISMGAALGEIVAFELAAVADGIVWFFGKEWASPKNRASAIWAPH